MQGLWSNAGHACFLVAVFGLILLALSIGPPPDAVPARDGDVFLYIGRQMLHGDVPYRDVWDHKGPLIYAINALGLALGNDHLWGIWLLRALSLAGTAFLCWRLLASAFSRAVAAYGVLVLLLALLFVVESGNYTEEYALPLQFTALSFLWLAGRKRHTSLAYAGLGATLAAAFLLRANNMGTPLVVLAVLFVTQLYARAWRDGLRLVLLALLGAALVLAPVLLYLTAQDALRAMYTQYLAYNLSYASAPWSLRLLIMLGFLSRVQPPLFNVLFFFAWLLLLWHLIRLKSQLSERRLLLVAVAADLPLQVFLSGLSGQIFPHYAILWLPAIAVLFAWLMAHTQQVARSRQHVATAAMFGALALAFASLPEQFPRAQAYQRSTVPSMSTVQELARHRNDFPYLVLWGSATGVHVVTQWPAPSRFVYHYPLYQDTPYAPAWSDEFIARIAATWPLIVDTSATNPRVPPIATGAFQTWREAVYLEQAAYEPFRSYNLDYAAGITAFIRQHYQPGETLDNGWQLWFPRAQTARDG